MAIDINHLACKQPRLFYAPHVYTTQAYNHQLWIRCERKNCPTRGREKKTRCNKSISDYYHLFVFRWRKKNVKDIRFWHGEDFHFISNESRFVMFFHENCLPNGRNPLSIVLQQLYNVFRHKRKSSHIIVVNLCVSASCCASAIAFFFFLLTISFRCYTFLSLKRMLAHLTAHLLLFHEWLNSVVIRVCAWFRPKSI